MNPRHLAKVLGMLGVMVLTGCPTSWNLWPKATETPRARPTLPPYGAIVQVGELSKRQFAPGEKVQMDVRLKALAFNGPITMTLIWCDGFPASKSIETTQTRVIQHEPFPSPRDCWVEVELFDMDKVQIGDASVSFKISTESVPATPAPAPPASPSVAPPAPAPATPAPTPDATLVPILPYRL